MRMAGWIFLNTLEIKRGEPIPLSRLSSEKPTEVKGQYV